MASCVTTEIPSWESTERVAQLLEPTPVEAELHRVYSEREPLIKRTFNKVKDSVFLHDYTSPSFWLEKFDKGKEIIRTVDRAVRDRFMYLTKHMDEFKKNVPFKPESPEALALGYLLELPDGSPELAKFGPRLNQAREFLRQRFEIHANEGGLEVTRRIKNYLPHVFDRSVLRSGYLQDIAQVAKETGTAADALVGMPVSQLEQFIKNPELLELVKRARAGLEKLTAGESVLYENLPQQLRFRFFETRQGATGFSYDAVKAYETYLSGLSRKLFLQNAVEKAAGNLADLPPAYAAFGKKYLKQVLGMGENIPDFADTLSQQVKELQFVRTIGFNPRTAVANLFQQIPAIVELGPKAQFEGWQLYLTKAGKELFEASGHGTDVPNIWVDRINPFTAPWKRAINAAGWMFNQVETANRATTYLGALARWYEKNAKTLTQSFDDMVKNKSFPEAATTYADDIVRKTQFRYGTVDMPLALHKGVQGAAFQFASFGIKTMELMWKWAAREGAEGRKKLLAFLGATAGVEFVGDLVGVDLKDVTGAPINVLDAMRAVVDLTQGDFKAAQRDIARASDIGFRFGPTVSMLSNLAEVKSKVAEGQKIGKVAEKFVLNDLTPVAAKRLYELTDILNANGNAAEFVANLAGFPRKETIIRREYMSQLERGNDKVAADLLDAYRRANGGVLPVDYAKVAKIKRELEREREEGRQDLARETERERIIRRFPRRVEKALLP